MTRSEYEQDINRAVGKRLHSARDFLGLTQDRVAQALGLSRSSIANIEAGLQPLTVARLVRFAVLYKVPVHRLLPDSPEHPYDVTKAEATETQTRMLRATAHLTENDRYAVMRFSQFLRHAGPPPPAP